MENLTPYFDFPPPHCLFTMILLGGSEEDLQVFTGETANAKAKSSENFLSPDQNWPNFGGFGGWGSGGTKSFNFYSKRHILARGNMSGQHLSGRVGPCWPVCLDLNSQYFCRILVISCRSSPCVIHQCACFHGKFRPGCEDACVTDRVTRVFHQINRPIHTDIRPIFNYLLTYLLT